jgi:hypothetical protein
MADHSVREHSVWSASATSRNWNCAGALALGAKVDKLDVESEAAAWGTACHEISEKCLLDVVPADHLIGTTVKTKQHTFTVDEEMADCAQEYVDYVQEQAHVFRSNPRPLWIEERFSLAKLDPPFDAGGTCDAIIYNPDEKLLEVVDLKGGRGVVVEVTENKQLRTYALGALLAHPELDVVKVKSTIVQPRAPHKDGRIRSETYHVSDLMEWTHELMERMQAAKKAEDALAKVSGALTRETWGDDFLVAGDHCTFCPAAGICPALESKALAVANAFFNDDGGTVVINQPNELDPARIAQVLDGADILGNWLNAVRALATRMAETGTEIPGYHLADRIGHRKWKDGVVAADIVAAADTDDVFESKLRSPAQVEKTVGAKKMKDRRAIFDALIHKPVTGRSLVSSAKSTRPAVKPKAEAWFS